MLELLIVAGASPDNPTQKRKIFDDAGGIIGRDSSADWVLHDVTRHISSQHARVIFSHGAYFLMDLSVNGIFKEDGSALRKGQQQSLQVGEVYRIGPYQFEVIRLDQGRVAESFKLAGLEHILSEPASESTELTPFVYAAKMPHVGTVTPEHNTLKAFDFMPEPIDFHVGELRKQDLISLFRQRFNLPADAFNGLTEMQFQQQIFEVYLAYLKKERESVGS